MKVFFLLLWAYCVCYNAVAQSLFLTDKISGEPIEGATILSSDPAAAATTNAKGSVDITSFQAANRIVIRHIRYNELNYSFEELAALNFKVGMTLKDRSMEETVVFSDRWSESRIDNPLRVEKISRKEVLFQNPQTTADMLGMSGYVYIQKSQMGGGSPMLRGMATNRVLLVVDGVRMNTAIFRAGNVQNVISLDANALQRTDIIFGPGAVMYGSDAIGGVMSFQTLEPQFASDNKKSVISGSALARTASANQEKTGHIDLNIGWKKLALLTSVTFSDYEDLRSGSVGGVRDLYRPHYVQTIGDTDYMVPNEDSTLQVGSAYSQLNFLQKIRYKPSKYWNLEYAYHFSETSDFNRYDRLYVMKTSGPNKNKLRFAEWYYGPQRWQMHRLGIEHLKTTRLFDKMRFIVAHQFFEESRYDREFMVREKQMQLENVKPISANFDLSKKISNKLSLQYGGEAIRNKVGSIASITNTATGEMDSAATRYPDGSTWQSYGAYVSAQYTPHKKWVINAGLRYSHFIINADFDTTLFPFPFSSAKLSNGSPGGSLGATFSPSTSWQLYIDGATGFRAPNIDDMGKVFESTPGYLVVPNPGLKPEQVLNVEIGTVKTFGNFLKLDVTAYHTWLKDAMVRRDFVFNGATTIQYLGNQSTVQAIQNVSKIQVWGIQAGAEVWYKGVGFKTNISYQNGREQSPDSLVYYPLRHAAPLFGSTHLSYERKKFRLEAYIMYNDKMDYEDLALTERINASYAKDEKGQNYSAAWHTFNFKAAWYPNEYITLTAGIENIGDRMYRPYSSGINAAGRNFIASLRARF